MERSINRRHFLAAAFSGVMGGFTNRAQSATDSMSDGTALFKTGASPVGEPSDFVPDAVGLETLATGMNVPLDVAFAPDADRCYIADKDGRIYLHEPDGLRDDLFLDLRDDVELDFEKGLLGIALHPDFSENRRFFARYSASRRPGTPEDYSHTFVLAEFEATADGRRAKRDSERAVLEIPQPHPNHNAGSINFGPGGYLYVGVGNGGGPGVGKGQADDWYDAVPGDNGQDVTENLLGSILRIDVDKRAGEKNYAVPDDNPLVGRDGLDEYYAWGFRNPWRMSFDGERFFVGDVGETSYEEVSLVEKGGNYGWNVKEGTHCYRADDCPDETPESVRGGEPLTDPIIEYPHDLDDAPAVSGNSVIGGHVYRGTALSGLEGAYVFADLDADGRLFVATRPEDGGDGLWPTRVVEVAGTDGGKLQRIFSFGRDESGAVYVLGSAVIEAEDESSGGLHRISSVE